MPKPTSAPAASKPVTSNINAMNNAKKNDARQGGGARTAGIFIAGVVVGLIIGWGWFSLGDRDTASVATTTGGQTTSSSSENSTMPDTGTVGTSVSGTPTTATMPAATASSNGISISSQTAGITVAVNSISVSVPTWVVIFQNNSGKPGNALGAQMFFPGQTSGSVALLRDTIAGQSYLAGEYVDNGDHQFSKQSDTQVTTVAGTPMLVTFTAR